MRGFLTTAGTAFVGSTLLASLIRPNLAHDPEKVWLGILCVVFSISLARTVTYWKSL